jgi:hypothetical protein
MTEIFLMLLVGLVVLLWQSAAKSKEFAMVIAARECKKKDLQLLDQTVVRYAMRLARDASGWPVVWRQYRFDYTDNGQSRSQGQFVLCGQRLVQIDLASEQIIIH